MTLFIFSGCFEAAVSVPVPDGAGFCFGAVGLRAVLFVGSPETEAKNAMGVYSASGSPEKETKLLFESFAIFPMQFCTSFSPIGILLKRP